MITTRKNGAKGKLLVVDDDEALRRLMQLELSETYEVIDTGEPEHGLAARKPRNTADSWGRQGTLKSRWISRPLRYSSGESPRRHDIFPGARCACGCACR